MRQVHDIGLPEHGLQLIADVLIGAVCRARMFFTAGGKSHDTSIEYTFTVDRGDDQAEVDVLEPVFVDLKSTMCPFDRLDDLVMDQLLQDLSREGFRGVNFTGNIPQTHPLAFNRIHGDIQSRPYAVLTCFGKHHTAKIRGNL